MLKVGQLIKAAENNKYLGLRLTNGYLLGVNSKMVLKAKERSKKHDDDNSVYVSFKELNINQYINCKCGFV